MALVLKDRVKQSASAPGTGTITLGATPAGFQSFAIIGNTNTTYFAIVDPSSGDWEVNYGTYTASGTTLSRNATPLSSSAGGALVNFTGAVDVFCTYPSSRSAYQNEAGTQVVQQSFGAITATSAALTTGTITTAPTTNTDIVNKQYADAIASGIHFHEAVELATTAALPANTYNNGTSGVGATLTANANGALSVDSTLTVVNYRVLVKNEVTQANNGVYVVTQVGSAGTPYILTRASDFDTAGSGVDQIDEGDFFLVTSGTVNANTAWVQQTPPPIVVGTTAIVFQQFAAPITYTAGTGLSESPTYTFNIANTTVSANTYGSASAVPVFAVNAQGQLTSVTNTNIAINGSAVSGAISGQAGSVANSLTAGTYLTGTAFNGSAAQTWTVDATSANTASKVVARDASGNFAAGTITATLSGAATSSTTATNLAGGAANQIPYQTAAGTTSFATAASGTNTVLNFNGSSFSWVNGTISGVALGSNLNALTLGTYLTGTSYNGSSTVTAAVDATSANTASKVVARDASGNFSAGTITAALSGNATTATSATTAGTITSQANSATITAASTNTANQIVLRDGSGNFAAGTITATLSGNASTATSATTAGTITSQANSATITAASTNTANQIVLRDASGNFSAGTITATLSGNASTATSATSATNATNATNVTGTVGVANGGTGLTSTPTNGQLNIGNGSGFTRATLTQGSGITITNGAGSITIAAAGGGFSAMSVITSSSTFTIPSGKTTLKITVIGAGAGASWGNAASGTAGGSSTVASGTQSISTITGGGGAQGTSYSFLGGLGGTGSGGDINFSGGDGGGSSNNRGGATAQQSGQGGSSFMGGGGYCVGNSSSTNGGNGRLYGGGGGAPAGGNGGGGGGTAIKYLTGVTPGNTLAITIGTGGTGGNGGSAVGGSGANGVVMIEY